MNVQLSSPDQLMHPVPYAHVAVGTGTRQVHVAGQVARDGEGQPTSADLEGQVADVLRNVGTALGSVDASFADVVRLTFYVTEWTPETIVPFMAGVERVAEELQLPQPFPPASVIGVSYLFEPDVRVELEAIAVLP